MVERRCTWRFASSTFSDLKVERNDLQGGRVVAIEADEEHDQIGPCRERGIVVRGQGVRSITSRMQIRILDSQTFGRCRLQQAVIGRNEDQRWQLVIN